MFLLIDNYDSFTFNLVQSFLQLGRTPLVLHNDDPSLPAMAAREDLDMVCIASGAGEQEAAGLCADFLARLARRPRHIPVLGVGLGHLLLGAFAGARTVFAPRPMHGRQAAITHDGTGLFSALPNDMLVGCYHSLQLDAHSLPDNLLVTARTRDDDSKIMAVRFADRPWTGVQFHPESVLSPEGARLLANFPSGLLAERDAKPLPDYRGRIKTRAPLQMASVMEKLARGENLAQEEAAEAFGRLMDGDLPSSQAGALLLGLRAKGETAQEVCEAVNAILARAIPVPAIFGDCIDIVGTGGDGKNSFNCSTATGLTLAAMGHKVLKHGNRSVSSRCGSADVLEQLGIALDTPPEAVPETLDRDKFVFLFAPRYHPSFRHIMPLRRELGVRTLFNTLGPLVNPARPTHHFLGVSSRAQLSLVAEALARSGGGVGGSGAVVHGAGGYDELTPMGEASVIFVNKGSTREARLDPAEYGFTPCAEGDLAVDGPQEAAGVLRDILHGDGPKAMRDMLALNLGFALYLLAPEQDADPDCGYNRLQMHKAMEQAKHAVASGAGRSFCHA